MHNQRNYGQHHQQVNQPSGDVESEKAKRPENQQDEKRH